MEQDKPNQPVTSEDIKQLTIAVTKIADRLHDLITAVLHAGEMSNKN